MAWETALDRLILQQIHRAEKGEIRAGEVQQQIVDLAGLAPQRPETAFHLGYARALLGIDLQIPSGDLSLQRWYTFGRLRGHDRRGERNWVADLLTEPNEIMELLREPRIATQCLPVAMRTLFWCGNLDLAVKAIEYLAGAEQDETAMLVDAALADLLSRLENRRDEGEQESTLSILQKCVQLECFERLPDDVRVGYWRALGERQLEISEFAEALTILQKAFDYATEEKRARSRVALCAALAEMRLHSVEELSPRIERPERDAAQRWLSTVPDNPEASAPEALFAKGMLAYEVAEFGDAAQLFDLCLKHFRRISGRDEQMRNRTSFFLAAALLAGGVTEESSRALRLMDTALETVQPDLESFYSVHEALKDKDRKLALRFLDSVDIGRGTAPDQLLIIALEYLSLGEADPASEAASRVLQIAVDLDQRIEAMRVLLTANNMRGDRQAAQLVYQEIRELLMQQGKFADLENLLKNEDFVGQALDHLEIKLEQVALYEEMEDREFEKASLQTAIARSLRARKDEESLHQAFGILREVEIAFPELAREDLAAIEKLLEIGDAEPAQLGAGAALVAKAARSLGRAPRVLVVGGNERQRRHHPRFEELAAEWGFEGEWLMANYSSPQKLVSTIGERLETGIELLVLLHWNRHETTEPALELARKAGIMARTVHYAGFTSLQVSLTDQLEKLTRQMDAAAPPPTKKKARAKA